MRPVTPDRIRKLILIEFGLLNRNVLITIFLLLDSLHDLVIVQNVELLLHLLLFSVKLVVEVLLKCKDPGLGLENLG